ncbi:MAG: GDP-mannose 4,6-dehydratase [Veillonellales bacterium]
MKTALITGITGQDGAYLADLLLKKGYRVHGLKRYASTDNTERIAHLRPAAPGEDGLLLHDGDLTDSANITRIVAEVEPDEIYNLGAQSHVKVSFATPEYTANTNAIGTLRLLEAIRMLGLTKKTRFYQASTSELFGDSQMVPQCETTPFYPRSPYAVAKLFAYWITINYREAYQIFACNGILFNHESPLRGETFVTRKITQGVVRITLGLQKTLYLGNLDAKRDWGYAGDYVQAIWLLLQQDEPTDCVIGTGECHTVREFATLAFENVGINIKWIGSGLEETGVNAATGEVLVRVDSRLFRPTEVSLLLADCSKATRKIGWRPTVSFAELVSLMVEEDFKQAKAVLVGRIST